MDVMVTGHRELDHTELVTARLIAVLDKLGADDNVVAVSGGAQGADTLWASAAASKGVAYDLVLPNRWYRSKYPDAIGDDIVAGARTVTYAVERPDVDDWASQWGAHRWWVDNFARNVAMIVRCDHAVVVSKYHPAELATHERGGTAHAVRELAKRSAKVIWVPDRDDTDVRWVQLHGPKTKQVAATLF